MTMMLRRRGLAALIAAGLLASASAFADELELIQPGELTVSTEGIFPPFSMRAPSGELDGLEIRLWREIAGRLGLAYEPVIMKWESTLIGLQAGQFDVMGTTMDITAARQEQILYSDAWLKSGGVLLVRDDSDIADVEDMAGRTIGALAACSSAGSHRRRRAPARA